MHTSFSTRTAALLACALLSTGAAAAKDAGLSRWSTTLPTPPLELTTLEGEPWDLSTLRGKVVVVNFWASWCGPCVDELPILAALAKRDGVVVVGVNFKEPLDTIERFTQSHPVPYTVLRDRTGEAFKRWTPGVLPATTIVDRMGRRRWSSVGEIPPGDNRLGKAIDRLLAEPQVNRTYNQK